MKRDYTPPNFKGDGYNCPHCGAFAHQTWYQIAFSGFRGGIEILNLGYLCFCTRCQQPQIWFDKELVYPSLSTAPLPSPDMPPDVLVDFNEARTIVNTSPRAAVALLRLAIQKLMPHLGETSGNLNDDIGNLVKKGLPFRIQKSLDSIRVIGNNAVHPGQINLQDDINTAISLFQLLNLIVDMTISSEKQIDEIYGILPDGAKEAIIKRDT